MEAHKRTSALPVLDVPQPSELNIASTESSSAHSVQDSSVKVSDSAVEVTSTDFGSDVFENAALSNLPSLRSNCKCETRRSKRIHAVISESVHIIRAAHASGIEHPLQEDAAAETTLTVSEVNVLTLRFLNFHERGVKATGPSGAATRATLGLAKTCLEVRNGLWPIEGKRASPPAQCAPGHLQQPRLETLRACRDAERVVSSCPSGERVLDRPQHRRRHVTRRRPDDDTLERGAGGNQARSIAPGMHKFQLAIPAPPGLPDAPV